MKRAKLYGGISLAVALASGTAIVLMLLVGVFSSGDARTDASSSAATTDGSDSGFGEGIKVHGDWCWIDTTPLDKQGRATAEGGPNLLHQENGKWKVMDLASVPEDPRDPLGLEDASPGYVKNLMKTFPGVPRDIFPKPSHSHSP